MFWFEWGQYFFFVCLWSFEKFKYFRDRYRGRNLLNELYFFVYVRSLLMKRGWGKFEFNFYSDGYKCN